MQGKLYKLEKFAPLGKGGKVKVHSNSAALKKPAVDEAKDTGFVYTPTELVATAPGSNNILLPPLIKSNLLRAKLICIV